MKVLVAIDSFKGSLNSSEAGRAIEKGIKKVYPDCAVDIKRIADGGEGTLDALINVFDCETVNINATGPLGNTVECAYAIKKDKSMAVIEMSAVAGLTLIDEKYRNPMKTTTYGLGEIIKDAIKRGCRKFIIGIGGSATNDGGVGMLQALGYKFTDTKGNEIPLGAGGLEKLHSIDCKYALSELNECSFKIACDVTNVLCGANGCSYVFGKQKGATPSQIALMDNWLKKYADISRCILGVDNMNIEGTGAAGGIGFAFLSYLNAELKSGIELILSETNIEDAIKSADLVITGEGKLDGQTVMGKAPIGIAKLAKKYNKAVIAFAGSVSDDANICNEFGIDAYFPIVRDITSLDYAMQKDIASRNLENTAEQVFRLIKYRPTI